MTNRYLLASALGLLTCFSFIQVAAQTACDPADTPDNLQVDDSNPSGLQLSWDATPGSVAARLRVTLPSGVTTGKTIIGSEPGAYFVPASALTSGTYVWQVQSGCSLTPPYDLTAFSSPNTFVFGSPGTCPLSVSDIDGNTYGVAEIDGNCWTTSHLETTRYNNGDSIPVRSSNAAWGASTDGASCFYDNDPVLGAELGYLYNWYAVDDARGLCPTGWHVPSESEMDAMIASLGSSPCNQLRATGNIVDGTGPWRAPNDQATNSSGFSGQPGGFRSNLGGGFSLLRSDGYYWSSTSTSPANARNYRLEYDRSDVNDYPNNKATGRSVRCVKD